MLFNDLRVIAFVFIAKAVTKNLQVLLSIINATDNVAIKDMSYDRQRY